MTKKFNNYITEYNEKKSEEGAKILSLVYKNCKQFIKEIDGNHLYRGVSGGAGLGAITERIPRPDRRPTDTAEWMHDFLNEQFRKKFGWPVRNGAFTVGDFDRADSFGFAMLFYPFDGYKYAWSPEVEDLTVSLGDYAKETPWVDPDSIKDKAMDEWEKKFGPDSGHGVWQNFSTGETFRKLQKYPGVIDYTVSAKAHNEWEATLLVQEDSIKKSDCYDIITEDTKTVSLTWMPELGPDAYYHDFKDEMYDEAERELNDIAMDEAKKKVKTYINRDLIKGIRSGHEISFNCKKYYVVHTTYLDIMQDAYQTGYKPEYIDPRQKSFSFIKKK